MTTALSDDPARLAGEALARRVLRGAPELERVGLPRDVVRGAVSVGAEKAVHALMAAGTSPARIAAAFARPAGAALPLTWARDFPPAKHPETIVGDLLEAGTLALVYGAPSAGKTTLATDIALAVASGSAWRGRPTRKGVVLWLALESAAGLRRRVAAYCIRHKLEPGQLLFADVTQAVRLLEPKDADAVIGTIRQAETEVGEPAALVVVDTVARALAGRDENDGRDMGALVGQCDRIRTETGAAVLLIHHSGKDSERGARGHSSLRAAVDTEIEVTGQANPRQAKVTKQRDLPSGDAFAFDLEPVEVGFDEDSGQPITACVVTHRGDVSPVKAAPMGRATSALLRALCNRQAEADSPLIWTLEELRKIGRDLGQHKGTARDAVTRLSVGGFLTPTVGGHRLADGVM